MLLREYVMVYLRSKYFNYDERLWLSHCPLAFMEIGRVKYEEQVRG